MNHKTDMQALAERLRLLLSGDAILAKSDFARSAIEQAIAALAGQSAAVPVWMPIETAPKTGRTLLLGYPNTLGKWRTTRGKWMSENYIAEYWEEPDDAEPGWYETPVEAEDIPNCWYIEPTHWMPLPPAPTAPAPVSEPEQPKQSVPAPLSEYHEDTGPVVWWTWQDGLWLGEPAWIGVPDDSDWPGYHTHWTYHPEFPLPPVAEPAEQPSERGEQDFESDKPIPIVSYDDGARVLLDSWTGGAHEAGVFGEVALRFIDAHGVETVREYRASPSQPQAAEPKGLTEERPSFTNPLTPYGMLVRALRIVAGTTLYDMAKALLTTPAKLSSMEFGRIEVTPEFAFDIAAHFDALGIPGTQQAISASLSRAKEQK